MKKLLSLIGAISIAGSGASAVISCTDNSPKPTNDDQAKADAIRDKITKVDLTINGSLPRGTENSPTQNAIKTALEEENPRLNTEDLAKISFAKTNLSPGASVAVKATITVGTATATKDLNVTLAQTNQQKADAIKEKIINLDLTVADTTKPDLTDATPIIRTALKSENPTLLDDDLTKITFTGANLQAGASVVVKATITVGAATAEKDLNVTLAETDQQKADAIRDKITNDTFNIPAGIPNNTTNTATIAAIKKALQTANTTLTADDLMKFTFTSATLRPYTEVTVLTTITVGTATATKDLKVTIAATDQEKADRIKNRITNVNLDIAAGINPDTTNTATIAAIKNALQGANPALTTEDLATISFSNTTLQAGTSVVVKATITVGTATAEKNLNVTLAQSDQQQADAIKAKIIDVDLTVPVGTNPDTTATTTVDAIKVALEADNVALTTSDLNTITFSNTTLQAGTSTQVIAIISVGTAVAEKDLNVTLTQSDQAKANAIRDKITDVALDVPAGTNPDTTNAATTAAIKTALEGVNPALTTEDLRTITLANATLQAGTSVVVKATINVGTATAEKDLNVTLAQTGQQKARALFDKITNPNVSVSPYTDPDTSDVFTVDTIRDALQSANPALTDDDKNKLLFNRTTLQAGVSVTVQSSVIFDGVTYTKDIYVTRLPWGQDKADAIKNKIQNNNLFVVPSTNTSTSNNDTVTTIKTALQSQNSSLTDDDMNKITLGSATLTAGSPVTVTAMITVDDATVEKDLNVTLAQTDQQQADAIQQKILASNYAYGWFPADPNDYNTTDADLRLRVKLNIRYSNGLTEDEAKTMSLEQGVQLIANTPVSVILTITVGGMTATKTINLTFVPI